MESIWSPLKIGPDLYIGKVERGINDSPFTFWLSNFKTLWSETIASQDEIIKRADINPTIPVDDNTTDRLIRAITTLANAVVTTDINPNDTEINLQLTYSIDGNISQKFHWLLKKCEPEEFFNQITKMLMRQIVELEDHKRQLIDMAKRKDLEIKQYKIEGAPELMRKRFITQEFQEDEFTSKCRMLNCDIENFRSVIGPLPKDVGKIEATKEESGSPVKNVEPKKYSSPRGIRNQRRILRVHKPIIPRGVVYDEDDDSDATSNNEPNQNDGTANPEKRARRSSDF